MSVSSVVLSGVQIEVSATDTSLVQESPTECCVLIEEPHKADSGPLGLSSDDLL